VTTLLMILTMVAGTYLVAVLEGWVSTGSFRLAGPIVSAVALLGRESLVPRKPDRIFFEVAPPLLLVSSVLALAVFVLATVVALVSAPVLLYAVGYLGEERDKARFYAGMSFFSATMQILVLAGDWILLLASWELIGLSSYLLIGFWYGREGVPQAATRAFLYTRTADLGLYGGIFVLITQTGTSEISATLEVGGAAAALAGLLFLVAAAGKSAQTPLQGCFAL
jgi:NADH-quinone oxidoreductase subunit L